MEAVLRAALLALLALALWRSLHPAATGPRVVHTDVRGLPRGLAEASRSPDVTALRVAMDSVPGRAALAWLRALPPAGLAVQWHGGPAPLAVQVERTREPESRTRVLVAADSGVAVALADSAGVLDSVRGSRRGAMLEAPALVGAVRAAVGRHAAVAPASDARPPRAVLVLGRAGWEARFVSAALEEAGWTVRARLPAAPGVTVADAGVLPLDTSRYAVVVALDSTARDLAGPIARFVGQGGGAVLAGEANDLPAVGALAPARAGGRQPGRILLDADSVTPADLPLRALVALRADAVRLEAVPGGAAVAVRRAGMGRVASVGYDETWRWRMLGGASGPAAHRGWWSRTVGLVAPEQSAAPGGPDAAPRATLVDALGPPTPAPPRAPRAPARTRKPLPLLLLALVVAALLAETASRRFRGAR
jgi:hypothetical protein